MLCENLTTALSHQSSTTQSSVNNLGRVTSTRSLKTKKSTWVTKMQICRRRNKSMSKSSCLRCKRSLRLTTCPSRLLILWMNARKDSHTSDSTKLAKISCLQPLKMPYYKTLKASRNWRKATSRRCRWVLQGHRAPEEKQICSTWRPRNNAKSLPKRKNFTTNRNWIQSKPRSLKTNRAIK